jgi:dUTP pyrophosphatase
MDEINSKELPIFDEIFGALDGVFDSDESGLEILSRILIMPDDSFEVIKPTLMNSIEATFNAPDARIAFAQMVNQQGLRIEDFANNIDDIVAAVGDMSADGVELSESKKDFLKFIFSTFTNTLEASNAVSHRVITIPIELCREDAKLPTYATDGSAAMDIYSPEEYVIGPGECMIIPTGLKVNIPIGYALLIQPRSGLSRKTKLRIANTPGLIDSDYHEEIGVIIENIDPPIKEANIVTLNDGTLEDANLYGSSFTIGKGERFAQMRLVEVPLVHWLEVDSLGTFESDHGKGFGSTGAT